MILILKQSALLVILILGGCNSFGQSAGSRVLTWKNKLKIADKFYEDGYYYDASHYYQQVIEDQPDNVDVTYKLAESHFLSRDYKQARDNYKLVMQKNEQLYALSRFKYALSLKMTGDYTSARPEFEKFIKEYRASDALAYKKIVKNEIAGCDYANEAIAHPLNVVVVHMSNEINAAYTEASPMPVGNDKFIYASLRSDTIIEAENLKSKTGRFKLYQSVKVNNRWGEGTPLPEIVNVPKMDVANGAFSPDGSKFFFTECESNDAGRLICSIYTGDYKDGVWSDVKKLNETINISGFTSSHPTVGEYKKKGSLILYFASDMPGGSGGLDIWYTEITSKWEYKPPVNLGNKINTLSDELTPFYNNNSRTLSFSSNGHPSMGGYDIFKAAGSMGKWSKPENTGYPLNSSVDDMYFVADDDEEGGYFVSNRKGVIALKSETCCDDIFRYNWDRDLIPKIAIDGFAFDDDKTMSVFPDRSKLQFHLLRAWGDTLRTTVLNEDNFFVFEKLPSLDNYLFVLDQSKANDSNATYLSTLSLLTKKGEQVVEAVINKDGYFVFEELPHLNNYLFSLDVVSDVNFKLYMVDPDSSEILVNELLVHKGDPFFFTLTQNKNYKLVAIKGGYFSNYITFSTFGMNKSDTLHRNLPLKKLELNKSIVLKDIYYDFDKATLRPESDKTLEMLVEILNDNPGIIVELGANTDSKGDDLYNQKLSQKRAESVVKYLKKAGIGKERLAAMGYGESQPIAPNTNPDGSDNPDGRQLNRRTEIKVIGETKVVVNKKKVTLDDAMKDAQD